MHRPGPRAAHTGRAGSLSGSTGTTHYGLAGADGAAIDGLAGYRTGSLPCRQAGPGRRGRRSLTGSRARLLQARQHGRIRRNNGPSGGLPRQIGTHLRAQRNVGRGCGGTTFSRRRGRSSGPRHGGTRRRWRTRRSRTHGRNRRTRARACRHDCGRWRCGRGNTRGGGSRWWRLWSWRELTGRRSRSCLRRQGLARAGDNLSRPSGRRSGPGGNGSAAQGRRHRLGRSAACFFASRGRGRTRRYPRCKGGRGRQAC